jgi:DNA-binding response OmpR family regulator
MSQIRPSILVVDDDPGVRSLVVDVLETEGYAVRAVEDGFAALRSVQDDRPDCIVLDVMMPGMNGHDVLLLVRSHEIEDHLPVVMLTAADDDEQMWRAWSEGVDYFLSKPFEPDELLRFLHYLFPEPARTALNPA